MNTENIETTNSQQITYKDILRGKITVTFLALIVVFVPIGLFQFLSQETWLTGHRIQFMFTGVVMFVGTGFYTQLDQGKDWVPIRNAALVYFAVAISFSAFLSIVFVDKSLTNLKVLIIACSFILGILKTIEIISKSQRLKTITAIFIIIVTLALSAYSYFLL